jgi:hypothetical protein
LIDSTKNYFDYQYISTTLNPEYINLTNDYTLLTIPSNGKLGYQDTNSSLGNGYQINNQSSELFEAGLILSTQNNKVSSTFRSSPNGSFTNDFKNISYPTYLHPSFAHQYTQTVFNDSSSSNSDPIGITVQQNAFTLQSNLYKHSIFIHLKLINNTTQTLDSIYAGYFLDFDIGNYVNNQSKYDTSLSLAYVYDVPGASKYYGFVKLTNQEVNIFAMDNSNVGGNNINPNDGFTNSEQFTASTSKLGRAQAGMGSALGNDVSMIYTLKSNKKLLPNDTTHVAFALLRANSLNELRTYAQAAIDTFKSIYTSQVPDEALIETCNATPLTISPSPGNTFQFYTETPDASSIPFLTGASYTYPSYIAKDTVYVTCIDNIFPSAVSKIILSDENCLPASNQNATNDQAFIIAPNPSTDFIQILANTQNIQSPMSVAIINSIGTTVYETNILQPSTQSFIPTQSLANGKYILKITTNDKTFVYSFIKSN